MLSADTMGLIMDCKKVNTLPFKGINLYNATAYVQEHTLINRGITTLGGSTVPQCIMSNNKNEAQERAIMGGIYFVASYLTPILLIPQYNKHFLKNKGIIKSLDGAAKKIILVPKKYLTPQADLKEGLRETAARFNKEDCQKAFQEIYARYNDEAKLKKDLLSVHQKVLTTDFITTGAMWSAIPWAATEFTEYKTKRTDYSGGFKLKNDTPKDKNKLQKSKRNKLLWNIFFSVIPGIIFGRAVTKGLSTPISKLEKSINPFNKILKKIAQNPHNFDYASGTNMSKTIYAAIWVLSSFPAKIISSRDANERRDRALRDIGLFTMFFGGDFLINNLAGRVADKIFGTKIMDNGKVRNFRALKALDLPQEVLKKTKNIGAGLYWFSLLANTALIGLALPKFLNKFLRYNISKEKQTQQQNQAFTKVSMKNFASDKKEVYGRK